MEHELEEIELRIFPNSQKLEFKTKAELDDYIRNELRGIRNGRYNFRKFKSVKSIPKDSVALFRFADSIMGWGEISTVAKYQPFVDDYGQKYEGYIMFKPGTVKSFDPPLTIWELEKVTGLIFHFKNNFNTGRVYYKIPMMFKPSIKSMVNEV